MKSCAVLLFIHLRHELCLCPEHPAVLVITVRYLSACVLVTLILLNKGPKVQVMLAIRICQRSHKVLPLSEKVKVRNLIRKEKSCMLTLLRAAGENEIFYS